MTTIDGTTPYAWPFDGVVDPARTALVITGTDAATSACTPRDDVSRARIDRLRHELADIGVAVVLVRHELLAVGGGHAEAERPGSGIPIEPFDSEVVLTAAGHDGFYGSPLDAVLRRDGRTHLLVAGVGLETTVHSTLRRANDRGYECLVIADACLSGEPALRAAAVSSIEMSGGIFGAVGHSAAVLAAFCEAPARTDPGAG